ncbi:MAG TPA: carbamoyltransferase N-terminal domain-containing protein, partial [Candidatus Hydrogenedentes bacterium]|nr:carbamoyltransferase N-terminal domain-containing protein [Candidatus Hydrogenedentota bacterium]
MRILGISAYYHDSAAALVCDGDIVAAAQEERFSRVKHDLAFPKDAIAYCLRAAGLAVADLDYVVFYDKPLVKFERLLMTYLSTAPKGLLSFFDQMPVWLKERFLMRNTIRRELDYHGDILFSTHHLSHAAAAFFPSPYDEAALITVDGVGEWETTTIGVGRGNKVEILKEITFPHSLGLLYSAFTYFTGFKVNSGEYKLMGLAPYGEPAYVDLIKRELVHIRDDGSFRLNMKYFAYCAGRRMTNARFARLFGGPPRRPEAPLTQREMDIAASIQAVTEEAMLRATRHVQRQTGMKNLVLAGGVALNCVANGRILRETPFENIWIQPAAGDAGGALGAALFLWYQLLDHERRAAGGDSQQASLLGPAYTDEQIRRFLDDAGARYHVCPDEPALVAKVAELI